MLVITRKVGQTFYIGDDIAVTIVAVNQNQVRVGITAPRRVEVLREELRYEKRKANEDNRGNLVTR